MSEDKHVQNAIKVGLEAANQHYLNFMIEDENAFDESIIVGIKSALNYIKSVKESGE